MKKVKTTVLFFALAFIILCSCNKNDYLVDGGLAKEYTSLSTYDYLTTNKDGYFDTLKLVIDHFSLKDSVNKTGTFFAPTDLSIKRLMTDLKAQSLDELYSKVSSKMLTQFMFSDTAISLYSATTVPTIYNNWADTIAGIKKTAYNYSSVTSFTYYILQYVKINGYADSDDSRPSNDPVDAVYNCQTSGIKTASGTTLHILSNISSIPAK